MYLVLGGLDMLAHIKALFESYGVPPELVMTTDSAHGAARLLGAGQPGTYFAVLTEFKVKDGFTVDFVASAKHSYPQTFFVGIGCPDVEQAVVERSVFQELEVNYMLYPLNSGLPSKESFGDMLKAMKLWLTPVSVEESPYPLVV